MEIFFRWNIMSRHSPTVVKVMSAICHKFNFNLSLSSGLFYCKKKSKHETAHVQMTVECFSSISISGWNNLHKTSTHIVTHKFDEDLPLETMLYPSSEIKISIADNEPMELNFKFSSVIIYNFPFSKRQSKRLVI